MHTGSDVLAMLRLLGFAQSCRAINTLHADDGFMIVCTTNNAAGGRCGFAIWNTTATVNGKPYNYSSAMSGYQAPPRDIVASFVESCTSVGVRIGIYYSVVSNAYVQPTA